MISVSNAVRLNFDFEQMVAEKNSLEYFHCFIPLLKHLQVRGNELKGNKIKSV